jgi:hypothetical protein
MAHPENRPTPERIFATLTAYQASAALSAAIRLVLLTHRGGAETLRPGARDGAPQRGLRAPPHMVASEFLPGRRERYRLTGEAGVPRQARAELHGLDTGT